MLRHFEGDGHLPKAAFLSPRLLLPPEEQREQLLRGTQLRLLLGFLVEIILGVVLVPLGFLKYLVPPLEDVWRVPFKDHILIGRFQGLPGPLLLLETH